MVVVVVVVVVVVAVVVVAGGVVLFWEALAELRTGTSPGVEWRRVASPTWIWLPRRRGNRTPPAAPPTHPPTLQPPSPPPTATCSLIGRLSTADVPETFVGKLLSLSLSLSIWLVSFSIWSAITVDFFFSLTVPPRKTR